MYFAVFTCDNSLIHISKKDKKVISSVYFSSYLISEVKQIKYRTHGVGFLQHNLLRQRKSLILKSLQRQKPDHIMIECAETFGN